MNTVPPHSPHSPHPQVAVVQSAVMRAQHGDGFMKDMGAIQQKARLACVHCLRAL